MITKEYLIELLKKDDHEMIKNIQTKMEITLAMLKDEYQKCLDEMYLSSTTLQFLNSIIELSDQWITLFDDQPQITHVFKEYKDFAENTKKSFNLNDDDLDELVSQITNLQDYSRTKMQNKKAFYEQNKQILDAKSTLNGKQVDEDFVQKLTYRYLGIIQEAEHLYTKITPKLEPLKSTHPKVFEHLDRFFKPMSIADIVKLGTK